MGAPLDISRLTDEQLLILEATLRKRTEYESFCYDSELFGEEVPARVHRLICSLAQQVLDGDIERLMIFAPPGVAKALALDTPIPTPSGWTTMGELRVGDQVFADDGKPCRVTWVSPIHRDRPVYAVRTDCGDNIIADRDHEWLVRLCGKPRNGGKSLDPTRKPKRWEPFKIKETHELARPRGKRPMIRRAGVLELPHADLPLDPYVLGVWLGDGTADSGSVTAGIEDGKWMRAEIERLGYRTTDCSVPTRFGVSGIRRHLAALGVLHDPAHGVTGYKHIPAQYLRASAEQRLALLQGLIDTEGTVCKRRGMATFSNTNLALALGVRELVRSLGVKAGWNEGLAKLNGKDCGPVYRVTFYHAQAARMPRKAALCRAATRTTNTYIDVTPAGTADTVCIEVDSPTHLFLCGRSMTPTHNSTYISKRLVAWAVAYQPGIKIIGASHTASLAAKHGREARNIVAHPAYRTIWPEVRLAKDLQARDDWATTEDSEFFGCGFDGGVVGRRGDLLIIDDPFKSRQDADSETIREAHWATYRTGLRTRLRKGGRIILMHQRWHEDDIAGRILPEGYDGRSGWITARDGEEWYVANLQMVCEADGDPLGRQRGELLWPEWFDEARVRQDKLSAGQRDWAALYQGVPTADEGALIPSHYWRVWPADTPPDVDYVVQVYDTAYEEGEEADYSARTTWGIFDIYAQSNAAALRETIERARERGEPMQRYHAILLEAWRGKVDFPTLKRTALDAYRQYEPDRVLIEKRASGHSLIQEMRRAGLPIKPLRADQSKLARTYAAQPAFEQGCVWRMDMDWTLPVVRECAQFPSGKHDDTHDTVMHAIGWLRRTYHLVLRGEEPDEDAEPLEATPIYG